MFKVRFLANANDYRPVSWPIKYPYWCSGYTGNEAILIAYVDEIDDIFKLWPEAKNLEYTEETEIVFSSRFVKPEWYNQEEV